MSPGTTRVRAESALPRRATGFFFLERPAPIGFGGAALIVAVLLLAR